MKRNHQGDSIYSDIVEMLVIFGEYTRTGLRHVDVGAISVYEPRQANLCLRAFRHDKFQLRMPSHSEGPGIWFSV